MARCEARRDSKMKMCWRGLQEKRARKNDASLTVYRLLKRNGCDLQ